MTQTSFYNLAGGINQSETKTSLGMDLKKIYWSDSKNVEILQNRGFIKQKGNVLFAKAPNSEKIIGLHQIKNGNLYNLIIITKSGRIYIYKPKTQEYKLLEKSLSGLSNPIFTDFLNGVIISSKTDAAFYIKN